MKLFNCLSLSLIAIFGISCGLDVTQSIVYKKVEHLPESSLPKCEVAKLPCLNIADDIRSGFLDEEVDGVEFVQLETSKKCLISFPKDFMYINGCYVILDQQTSNLMVFDANGKFLRQIGRRGQGPKEYDHLGCFSFMNNRFYMVDTYTNDLLCFEWNGNFVSKTHLDINDYPVGMSVMNNELYLAFGGNFPRQPYRVLSITPDCKYGEKLFPYEYTYPQVGEQLSKAINGNLLLNPSHSDTIFEISHDCVIPRFKLGYYQAEEPDEIRLKYCSLGPNEYYKYINSVEDKSLTDFRIHDLVDCVILEYSTSPKVAYLSIVDKRDNSCVTYQRYNRLKQENELPFHLFYSDNIDHLISFCIDKEWIKEHPLFYGKMSQEQKDLLASHESEDNPMIIKIKIKKR